MSAETPNKIIFFEDIGQFLTSAPIIRKDYFGFYYRDGFFRVGSYTGPEQIISMGAPGTYVLRSGDTMSGDLDMQGHSVTGIPTPTAATDATNKQYVDAILTGAAIDAKSPVRVATTGNISLSGLPVVDGISLNAGDRVLVKDQLDQEDNGIYVAAVGAWSRAADADDDSEVTPGMFCFAQEGAVNANIGFILVTPNPIIVGVTPLEFSPFTSYNIYTADGNGLKISGNQFFVSLDGTTLSQSALGLKVNTITDSNIAAGVSRAKIAAGTINRLVYNDGVTGLLSDLAAITPARALVSDANGLPTHSSVTSVEIGYISGVTSGIQLQLNNKQPLDADLTSIASQTGTGILVRTGTDTWTLRAVSGTTGQIDVIDGNGVAGNPTIGLADTTVTPGTYGDSDRSAQIVVDSKGRITSAVDILITPAAIGAQPASSELTGIAALATLGIIVRSASGTYIIRAISAGSAISITNGNGVAGNPTIAVSGITDSNVDIGANIGRSKLASGGAHRILVNDASGVMSEAAALTNGQILIGSTGAAPVAASITGTVNQVTVTNGPGSITLATPQDIATTSSPTFAGLTLTGFNGAVKASSGILSASQIINADISASAAIEFSKMAALTINRALVSDGSGVVSVSAVTSTELANLSGVDFLLTTHGSRHNPGGDDALSTAAPSVSLSATTTNSEGTAGSFARSDHGHEILTGTPSSQAPDQANDTGTSANLARADHIHNIATGTPVNTGTANANGTAPTFARSDHVHNTVITHAEVKSGTAFSTTSTTDVVVTGFTTTPVAGTYAVFVNADGSYGDNNRISTISIYVGGVQVANTARSVNHLDQTRQHKLSTQAIVTVDGSQAIDVRVRTNAGTLTVGNRSLIVIRLGS